MTAIAGLWRLDGRPDAEEGCERMLSAQAIYGRHDGALWAQGSIALGRRLHSMLPEDRYDRQPLVGGDGRFTLVADVRLDNREELCGSLGIDAARARELCDAALLLAAFERWDADCCDRLLGDYAFAVWDAEQRRLVMARDPIGQRPLHFHRGKDFFAFASMPKGLHALADVPLAPDEERIAQFLVLLPETGSRSFFRSVERIEPGQVAIATAGGLAARRHWEPERRLQTHLSTDDCVEGLRAHLDAAVSVRLRGAEQVGTHLSAGLDSSGVSATTARLLAPRGRRVLAFTGVPREGYSDPAPKHRIADEGLLAAETAAMYPNIEHVLVRGARTPLDDLDRSFYLYDQPALNICNGVWINAINDAARQRRVTVLLTGFLGNMTLSYDGIPLLPELIGSGRWLQWWQTGRALVARRHMSWKGLLAQSFGPWTPVAAWSWINRVATGHATELGQYSPIHPRRFADLDLAACARERDLDLAYRPRKDGFKARLWVLRRADLGNYNKGALAGWGIDQRDPTADRRLIEYCLSLPTERFLADGEPRALARRVLADRLPQRVLEERRRGYQGADWHEQLTAARSGVASELERLAACRPAAEALDLARLRRLADNWPSGGWERPEVNMPYRLALMRGISTGHFLRRASGANT